ncbi:MAG TPA: LLM class flavin-dependent oxidoreductase [Acidimicrobiales bacterium]|jgi:luciferase family oxidoreductase group 1|nr:LLM class flavin-dependent oxidoreductase [Acidimicrobiales bacterium]
MTLSRCVPLSVLDLSPIASGASPGEALRNSIDLARRAEDLGYHRFWVAEHHNMPGIASSAPAVLIAHLADATEAMRIGSGGVMLPNHPPLVVAEQFGMLEALHPGRIDLGIGRAPGTDPATAAALRRSAAGSSADDFPEQLGDLLGFFQGSFPAEHPYANIRAVPGLGDMPALWLLGSSGYSAQVAGALGVPFAFAHHFSSSSTLPALELYRECFRPSAVLAQPYVMIGAAVLCADSDDAAVFLHGSSRLQMLRLRTGMPGPVPSPEEAAAYPYTAAELALVHKHTGSHIVGDPATVTRGLDDLIAATGVDEVMVTSVTYDHKARVRSFELVAELAGLGAAV